MLFKKNEPAVVSETIDGEVVAINLDSGVYFSLQGSAASIWSLLEAGADSDAIAAELDRRHAGGADAICAALARFLDELQAEQLVVPAGEATASGPAAPAAAAGDTDRPAFERPVLSKYTDMQDLLLLDPIHEVDERGWPNAKPGK